MTHRRSTTTTGAVLALARQSRRRFRESLCPRAVEQADRVVFTSEAIENIPADFRTRRTYVFSGSDQFEEIFEIAEAGTDSHIYSRSRLIRRRTAWCSSLDARASLYHAGPVRSGY